jgi:Tol biopolymer transport system component
MRFRAALLAVASAGLLSGADVGAGVRPGPGELDIYVARADGSLVRNLTRHGEVDDAPVVSPDGRKIAFVRGIPPSTDIYEMNADGSGQTQRTAAKDREFDPAWGPDGKAFAFTYFEPGTSAPRVRVLGWGRDVRRRGAFVRFAPSGRAIVFSEAPGIATLSRATGAVRRVSRGAARDPVWSPASLRIAFTQVTASGSFVAVMNANGTRVRRLARGEGPNWSKRGLIAFVQAGDVFVVRPDGRGLRRLTRGSDFDSVPTWSPDGRRLAFVRETAPDARLVYAVGADGSGLTSISQSSGIVSQARPAWSPDGRLLYYAVRQPIVPQ